MKVFWIKIGLYLLSGVLLLAASLYLAWHAITGTFRRAP